MWGISVYLLFLPVLCSAVVYLNDRMSGRGAETNRARLIFLEDRSLRLESGSEIYVVLKPEIYVPLQDLPESLPVGLIFQEDQSFFRHRGYSMTEIFHAVWDFLFMGRKLRGASTITQQLARTLFLNRDKTVRRKLLEVRISRLLEENLTKKEILELYLNYVYWGKNLHGISQAAAFYFKKPAEFLNQRETIALISILPNPDVCNKPLNCTNSGVRFRQNRILAHIEERRRER